MKNNEVSQVRKNANGQEGGNAPVKAPGPRVGVVGRGLITGLLLVGGASCDGGREGNPQVQADAGKTDADLSIDNSPCEYPSCQPKTASALLVAKQQPLELMGYKVYLVDTKEPGDEQAAIIAVVDPCGATKEKQIMEQGSHQLVFEKGAVDIVVGDVTVLDPKTARVTATLSCAPESDGGI